MITFLRMCPPNGLRPIPCDLHTLQLNKKTATALDIQDSCCTLNIPRSGAVLGAFLSASET